MTTEASIVSLSAIDALRFGIRIARAPELHVDTLPMALSFCGDNGVRMLIARCDSDDFETVRALENAGGRLMDVLVYYGRDLTTALPSANYNALVRMSTAGDAEALEYVAAEAFVDYKGHYHADPRLDRRAATEAYASWARRSVEVPGVADSVLVACIDNRILGFSALRLVDESIGEVVLNAVAPEAQRRGIYRSLLVRSMEWVRDEGRSRFIISTHLSNTVVRRVWAQYGLEPYASYFTFHLWFD